MEFNIKEHKWFIRIEDAEHSEIVQKWLFEQGVNWQWSTGKPENTRFEFLTNTYSDGDLSKHLLYANNKGSVSKQCKELIIRTKTETVVSEVVYPEIETEQQKQIRELKETIAKAQEQLDALEGNL